MIEATAQSSAWLTGDKHRTLSHQARRRSPAICCLFLAATLHRHGHSAGPPLCPHKRNQKGVIIPQDVKTEDLPVRASLWVFLARWVSFRLFTLLWFPLVRRDALPGPTCWLCISVTLNSSERERSEPPLRLSRRNGTYQVSSKTSDRVAGRKKRAVCANPR